MLTCFGFEEIKKEAMGSSTGTEGSFPENTGEGIGTVYSHSPQCSACFPPFSRAELREGILELFVSKSHSDLGKVPEAKHGAKMPLTGPSPSGYCSSPSNEVIT